MSDLGIYEGCYALLMNGDVVGPLSKATWSKNYPWRFAKMGIVECWNENGTHYEHEHKDIVHVMPADAIKLTMSKTYGDFSKFGQAGIPPHVTKAAMDAGIKAEPAYEQFVNAVLTAGFKAQYGIGFVPVAEQAPITVTDELLEQMASVFGDKGFYELGDTAQQKLRGAAECAVAFFGGKQVVLKNESENRIPDSEKTKGGLSGLPLEGVTICFTGSMNTPVDTHKGIAEALGAKVSGSVHSNTTLVVLGVGALSKLDKAIELDLPRISESGWMWMARLFAAKLGNESENRIPNSEKPKGGLSAIPSVREIHDQVLAEVTDWRAKYGRDSMPSTFSIAQAFHRMLTPLASGEPSNPFDALETTEYKSTNE